MSPAGPAPMTATFLPLLGMRSGVQGFISSWSAMKRFTWRTATGASISPRRHFCSQKAGQTRPQIAAKGLRSR